MTSVYVQVPAFEEPQRLPSTLDAIRAQQTPPEYDVRLEAWVTPSRDETGRCSTLDAARRVLSNAAVFEAPNGKLSTRNRAHDHAFENGADIIVSWDADAGPEHDDVLTALVTTLDEPGVVAANSVPVSNDGSVLGALVGLVGFVEDSVRPHVHGQLHTVTRHAWKQAGPFRVPKETNIASVRREEEFAFHDRLQRLGKVRTAKDARVFNDPRRHYCRLPDPPEEDYCRRIGGDTF